MNVQAVGDAAMVGAFEVIGIPGRVPEPGQDLGALLTVLAREHGARLLFVQTTLAASLSDARLDELRGRWGCLVQDVPGPGDPVPDVTQFRRRVQAVVGGAA